MREAKSFGPKLDLKQMGVILLFYKGRLFVGGRVGRGMPAPGAPASASTLPAAAQPWPYSAFAEQG